MSLSNFYPEFFILIDGRGNVAHATVKPNEGTDKQIRAKIRKFHPRRKCITQVVYFTFYKIIFSFSFIFSSEFNSFLLKTRGKKRNIDM